ncbi:hypothetical protein CRV12_00885 [Candidatus Pantoea edessiphila]|uniref:CBS domain-containing protein n=1 Tax=Candidatus Pantoea edessiphila TaxID=2044610 RepID=A0A2P5T0Q9_9GAMM|nr:CBS domain-containing protein [Candidatus Pantoea edessiphila]PPI88179.1 hypothetical protein CRV12_00885 [Candidatus Pantoea edessiphila]
MNIILNPSIWIGLLTLIVIEIVLGIDNLIFVTILTNNLPIKQRDKARVIGLSLALIMRLCLIVIISWLKTLNKFLWKLNSFNFSERNIILLIGGIFLIYKATIELHKKIKNNPKDILNSKKYSNFWLIVVQIVILDVVFSFDAIITAAGMMNDVFLMIIAVIIAVIVMFLASKPLINFINSHPNTGILCLSFLLIIGLSLVAESFNFYIHKSYLYSIIIFSIFIEILNQIANSNSISKKYLLNQDKSEIILQLMNIKNNLRCNSYNHNCIFSKKIKTKIVNREIYTIYNILMLYSQSIKNIMTPRDKISWIDVNEPIDIIQNKLIQTNYSLFPICHKQLDKIIGVIRAKDLLIKLKYKTNLASFACHQPITFALEGMNLFQLIDIIHNSKNDFVIVVNDFGVIQGIVTSFDILKTISNPFSIINKINKDFY